MSSVRLAVSWQLSGTGAWPSGVGVCCVAGGHFFVLSSSAVPVLPATTTPGICAFTPVPPRTTPTIRRRTVRAVFGSTTRLVGAACGEAGSASVSFGERPSSAIVAATFAICSAVAWTRPWPIADEPTARSSPISDACGIVLSAAPGMSERVVEAEALGQVDQPHGAERRAERREDRVARDRERLRERAAAVLAVGVVELDAAQRSSTVAYGIRRLRGRRACASSAPVSVMILNVEPGGCSARERDAGEREDLAACAA